MRDSLDWLGSTPGAASGDLAEYPDVGIRPAELQTESGRGDGVAAESLSPSGMTTSSLVSQYVESRRRDYLEEGWALFRAGDYRKACDVFAIAQAISRDDPEAMARVKIGLFWSASASYQHTLSIVTLRWLLTPGENGQPRDARLFDHLGNLRSHYGDGLEREQEYQAHVRTVYELAGQDRGSLEAQALRVVVQWAQGAQSDALFAARRIAQSGPGTPWAEMERLMENSLRADGQRETPVDQTVATPARILPFEAPGAVQ